MANYNSTVLMSADIAENDISKNTRWCYYNAVLRSFTFNNDKGLFGNDYYAVVAPPIRKKAPLNSLKSSSA